MIFFSSSVFCSGQIVDRKIVRYDNHSTILYLTKCCLSKSNVCRPYIPVNKNDKKDKVEKELIRLL